MWPAGVRFLGWRCLLVRRRIIRPSVSWIAPAHFLRHRCPAPGPEARQIPGGLDWTASGWNEAEHQRGTAAPDAGMFGKSEQRLDPQFHSRAAFRAIID